VPKGSGAWGGAPGGGGAWGWTRGVQPEREAPTAPGERARRRGLLLCTQTMPDDAAEEKRVQR